MSYDISTISKDGKSGVERIALAGELCIFHAEELKPKLLQLLKPDAVCETDLSKVTEIDCAGVQLLILAKREAASLGCELSFVSHGEPVLAVIELLNLSRSFGDPVLITVGQEQLHES